MHLLSKHGVSIVIIVLVNLIIAACTFHYHILHDLSYAFMELMHMHAIGATEEIMLVELNVDPQEENQEVQNLEVPEEGEPKADHLPECPDHQYATFMKGKT